MEPRELIDLFLDRCRQAFGPRLECIILTGSYARGEQSPQSDIDLWVFINKLNVQDLEQVGAIIKQIGNRPELNPQCTSFAEFQTAAFKNQFTHAQFYLDGKVLFGELPKPAPTQSEIASTASSIAAMVLMSARHYITVNESGESLAKGRLQKWVLKPLMWSLRYRCYSISKNYPRTLDELYAALQEPIEKFLVETYRKLLMNEFSSSYMKIVMKAEGVARRIL